MRMLVLYYSLDGNTRLIAERLAAEVGADLQELETAQDIGRGFMRYLRGGSQVIRKRWPELLPLRLNPEDYDLIFMGTPVWAGSYVPAFSTFLAAHPLRDKKIALFACYGGQAGATFTRFREALPGNEILGETGFKDPLKCDTEENLRQAAAWAARMLAEANRLHG